VEDNIEMDFRNQFVVVNGTEDFQYRPIWGSDMNSIVHCASYNVHSGCGSTAGYFTSQHDNYLVGCLIRKVENLHLVP